MNLYVRSIPIASVILSDDHSRKKLGVPYLSHSIRIPRLMEKSGCQYSTCDFEDRVLILRTAVQI